MSWWWLLVILLVLVASWLLQTALGAILPASTTGRFYLRDKLKKSGVLPSVPDGCVRELVDKDIELARMTRGKGVSLRTAMVEYLDSTAMVTALWIRGQDLPVKEDGYVPSTLLKYGVARGGLKRLG